MITDAIQKTLATLGGQVMNLPAVHWVAAYWWWLVWGAAALALLTITAKIKEVGGWPAVFAEFVVIAYLTGFIRGKHAMDVRPWVNTGPKAAVIPVLRGQARVPVRR